MVRALQQAGADRKTGCVDRVSGRIQTHGTDSMFDRSAIRHCMHFFWFLVPWAAVSCTESSLRLQSNDTLDDVIAEVMLLRDITDAVGGYPMEIQAIGLVGNLDQTGGDPPPSGFRQILLTEMQKRGVDSPSQILASPNTALVLARAMVPPGIQKGDRFDVEVYVPQEHAEVTSLRDGVMYEARLAEQAVAGGRLRQGKVIGLAKGTLLVDPAGDPNERSGELRRGVILGGAVALEARQIGLLIRSESQSVRTSAQVGTAINRRFYRTQRGIKAGVATPKTDEYVELVIHPRYKDNIYRYVDVLRSIPVQETTAQRQLRLRYLGRRLADPLTAADAALQLEAIGLDAESVLLRGLESQDAEVRFRAAESLAYLDRPEAAEACGEAIREYPAFRAAALTALGSMDDPAARDQLVQLLGESSAEARYGAFRALRSMNKLDPVVRGEDLDGAFSYHVLDTAGPAMVHVARSRRAELILFGPEEHLRTPVILDAGKYIQINGTAIDRVEVVKNLPGKPEQRREVTAVVDDVIRAIVEVGGSYSDVVQALTQAKASGSLKCRLEVDALPAWGRKFESEKLARRDGEGAVSLVSAEEDASSRDPGVEVDAGEIRLQQTGRAAVFESEDEEASSSGKNADSAGSGGFFRVPDRRWSWPPQIGRMWSERGE